MEEAMLENEWTPEIIALMCQIYQLPSPRLISKSNNPATNEMIAALTDKLAKLVVDNERKPEFAGPPLFLARRQGGAQIIPFPKQHRSKKPDAERAIAVVCGDFSDHSLAEIALGHRRFQHAYQLMANDKRHTNPLKRDSHLNFISDKIIDHKNALIRKVLSLVESRIKKQFLAKRNGGAEIYHFSQPPKG